MEREVKYPTECPACGGSSWELDSDDKCVTRYCGDCGQEMQPIEPLDIALDVAQHDVESLGMLYSEEKERGDNLQAENKQLREALARTM